MTKTLRKTADCECDYRLADFTPYYLLNSFLPVFWFTYLGVAATYVIVATFFAPAVDQTILVPILYYTLATAFSCLTIACMVMAHMIREYDLHRAMQIMKIPAFVALVFLGLRFLVPVIQYIQIIFVGS